ncbi:hypothetical protein D3C85_1859010 [compost metagenome]
MAATPGGMAVMQRGQRAHHTEGATQDVVDGRRHPLWRIGAAIDIGQPAHHLHHFVQCRPMLVGT